MPSTSFDIAILGSGPVGCALALGLARHAPDPARIALMGPAPAARAAGRSTDPRALALNQGSRQWLEMLGAWPAQAADILSVHVSQAGHLGRTVIDRAGLGSPRLGSVMRNMSTVVPGNFFELVPGSGPTPERRARAIVEAIDANDADRAADACVGLLTEQGDLLFKLLASRGMFAVDD